MNINITDEHIQKLANDLTIETLVKLVLVLQEENQELTKAKSKIIELENEIAQQNILIEDYKRSSYFYNLEKERNGELPF